MQPRSVKKHSIGSPNRLQMVYGLLFIIFAIFLVRLFYLQVIRHDFYKTAALSGQFKEYEVPAERGVILAQDGNNAVPIVLNEEVFTIFADPAYIKDPKDTAGKLSAIIGGDPAGYEELMKTADPV